MRHLSEHVREQLSQAIMALLKDASFPVRLLTFNQYLAVLKLYEHEIPPGILEELRGISRGFGDFGNEGNLVMSVKELTAEQEAQLTEALLSIYIDLRGGALLF
jgi:hypothetical protein